MRIHDLAFYLAVFFMMGLTAASLAFNLWLVLLGTVILQIWFFLKKKSLISALLPIIVLVGLYYYHLYAVLNKEVIVYGEANAFIGFISREPKYGSNSQTLNVNLSAPYKGEVIVYTSPYPEFYYGDEISFEGTIKQDLLNRSVSSFPKIDLVSHGNGNKFLTSLFQIKNKLISNLERVLPPDKSALISGILFGERAEFSKEFTQNLNKSGTTHIVALSGYNISIIGVVLSSVLSFVVSRRKAFYISLFFIVAFVLMTGAEASVVRAAIMGVIAMLAETQSRLYSFRNAIVLTALAMLLFDPKLLVFNVGFELSFGALLGIVYLQPLIVKLISRFYEDVGNPGAFGWRKNLIQTFSAQVAVAPILISKFGYLSPFSLLSNVLVLEFIPLTMALGFITAVLGIFSYHLSLIIGWLLNIFLGYEIFIINLFGSY